MEISNECKFKIYGDLDKCTNRFVKISVLDYDFECGIIYYDLGIKPQILFDETNSILYMGFEKWVLCINYSDRTEIFKQKSVSAFFEFLETNIFIIAICELDIFGFDREANLIWSIGLRDIVEDYCIIDDLTISITCADGTKTEYMLINGATL